MKSGGASSRFLLSSVVMTFKVDQIPIESCIALKHYKLLIIIYYWVKFSLKHSESVGVASLCASLGILSLSLVNFPTKAM